MQLAHFGERCTYKVVCVRLLHVLSYTVDSSHLFEVGANSCSKLTDLHASLAQSVQVAVFFIGRSLAHISRTIRPSIGIGKAE